jgi:hypothetical protein
VVLVGTLFTDFAPTETGFVLASTAESFRYRAAVRKAQWLIEPPTSPPCWEPSQVLVHHENYQVTAVGVDSAGFLVVQARQSAAILHKVGATASVIALSDLDRKDAGLELFHGKTSSNLACASCHPAGLDDGHVWNFEDRGLRRTQSLAGTLAGTAPYHWDGEMSDLEQLMTAVLTDAMPGPELDNATEEAFATWLLSLSPPVRPTGEWKAVARGRALFEDPAVGCAGCHQGQTLTNNQTVDVGTGAERQVPSLIGLRQRAPYMHDGCAATLAQRFDPACGGSAHGETQHLSPAQKDDLIAYLETL